jgi:hypothetical protein
MMRRQHGRVEGIVGGQCRCSAVQCGAVQVQSVQVLWLKLALTDPPDYTVLLIDCTINRLDY